MLLTLFLSICLLNWDLSLTFYHNSFWFTDLFPGSSQRDRDSRTGTLDLIVYYEVPEGNRDEVKQLFNIRNQ